MQSLRLPSLLCLVVPFGGNSHSPHAADDAELMIDVARLLHSTAMAETMFHGVRVGGAGAFNAPFSWGFGRQTSTPSANHPHENKALPSS